MTTLRRHKQLPATWRIVLNEYSQVDVDATNNSTNNNSVHNAPSRHQNFNSRDAGGKPQLTSDDRREQAASFPRARVLGESDDSTTGTQMTGKRYRTRRELDSLAGLAHPHTSSLQQHPSVHNAHYRQQQHTAPVHRVHSNSNSRTHYSLTNTPSLGAVESTQRVVAYPREIPRRID